MYCLLNMTTSSSRWMSSTEASSGSGPDLSPKEPTGPDLRGDPAPATAGIRAAIIAICVVVCVAGRDDLYHDNEDSQSDETLSQTFGQWQCNFQMKAPLSMAEKLKCARETVPIFYCWRVVLGAIKFLWGRNAESAHPVELEPSILHA